MKPKILLALLSMLALFVWGCPGGGDDDDDVVDDDSSSDDDDDDSSSDDDDDDSGSDDDDDSGAVNITSSVEYSECLGGGQPAPTMAMELQGGALQVHLTEWELNCCVEMAVETVLVEDVIKIFLVDHGEPCDCLCGFDVDVTVDGLPAGTYDVVVIGGGGAVANGAIEIS